MIAELIHQKKIDRKEEKSEWVKFKDWFGSFY